MISVALVDARHGQLRASGHHGDGGLGAAWRVLFLFFSTAVVDGIPWNPAKIMVCYGFLMLNGW